MSSNRRLPTLWYIKTNTMSHVKRTDYCLTQQHKWSSQVRCWEKEATQRRGPGGWVLLHEVQNQTKLACGYLVGWLLGRAGTAWEKVRRSLLSAGNIPPCDRVNTHVKIDPAMHVRYVHLKFKNKGEFRNSQPYESRMQMTQVREIVDTKLF